MKNFLFLFVIVCSSISCQEDIKFNNPAIQAQKQGVLWRANDFKATLTADGKVVIVGNRGLESISIKTFTIAPHKSILGIDALNFAEYTNKVVGSKGNYSTGFNGGDGEVVIDKYENGTLTGSFKFKAINTNIQLESPDATNFTQGVFYKIPVIKVK